MRLEEKQITLRTLTPETKVNWLTNGKSYSQLVYLGSEADPNDWNEITQEEYEMAQKLLNTEVME